MNPDQMRDASLLELFQIETRTQVQVLNDGLLALEKNPTSAPQLEACMRAAHSLKGAARIVDLHPAVRIAHAMEDCLVAAQEGRLRLQAGDIDALLLGTDLLQRVATPGVELDAEIGDLVARLSSAPNLPATSSAAVARPSRPSGHLPPIRLTEDAPVPAAPAPADKPQVVDAAAAVPSARRSSDRSAGEGERVLRVTADTLNKLLGLSSETLVESQWVGPFSAAMLRLRRLQAGAAHALDGVRAVLAEQQLDARGQAALDDAHRILEQCQRELTLRASEVDEFGWRMNHLTRRLYDTALACRMRPFGDGVGGMARMVRDLGRSLGKQVRLEIEGEDTQVDRDILEKLDAPLMHLLRNAVDHGIESPAQREQAGKPAEGLITLSARHSAGMLLVELADDGSGISLDHLREEVVERKLTNAETAARLSEAELLEFLFLSGFSTRDEVTEISGRGVGLDVVQTMVRQLRGAVRVHQQQGRGTRFVLEMPLSLSVVRSLLVQVQDEIYAFPLAYVSHALQVDATDIEPAALPIPGAADRPGVGAADPASRRGRPGRRYLVRGGGGRSRPPLRHRRRPVRGRAHAGRAAAGPPAGQGAGRHGRLADGRRHAASDSGRRGHAGVRSEAYRGRAPVAGRQRGGRGGRAPPQARAGGGRFIDGSRA